MTLDATVGGWKIINRSDFDPKTQEIYGAKKAEVKPISEAKARTKRKGK